MAKSRKVRSDIRIGTLEKKLGLEPGSIRNPDGTDARSNKKLETLRKEFTKAKSGKIKTNPTISTKSISRAAKAVSELSSGKFVANKSKPATKVVKAVTSKPKAKSSIPKKAKRAIKPKGGAKAK